MSTVSELRNQYNRKVDVYANEKNDNDIAFGRRVKELAELLKDIYIKSDQKFQISTISAEIAKDFKVRGVKNWHHVHDFLPDEFKSQKHIESVNKRWKELIAEIDPLEASRIGDDTIVYVNLPEQITRENIHEVWDSVIDAKDKIIDKADEIGISLIKQPSQQGWSSPAEVDTGKTSTIEPPETDDEVNKIIDEVEADWMKTFREFFKEQRRFWVQNKKNVPRWRNGLNAIIGVFKWMLDDKYSEDMSSWFDREIYHQYHGKHAAAVWRKAETILCKTCSENILEDDNDFEIMAVDSTSSTGWRCPKCKGTEGLERSMTREQIGDRSEFILNYANNLLVNFPGFLDLVWWYREAGAKQKYNTGRKPLLSKELSDKS